MHYKHKGLLGLQQIHFSQFAINRTAQKTYSGQ